MQVVQKWYVLIELFPAFFPMAKVEAPIVQIIDLSFVIKTPGELNICMIPGSLHCLCKLNLKLLEPSFSVIQVIVNCSTAIWFMCFKLWSQDSWEFCIRNSHPDVYWPSNVVGLPANLVLSVYYASEV